MTSFLPSTLYGNDILVAPLDTIDLGRLLAKEPAEIDRLLQSCITHGFFYLDLQTCDVGRQILADEQDVLRVMREYFDQPVEKKAVDDKKSFACGYKPIGTFGGVKKGTRDCHETLTVAPAETVGAYFPSSLKEEAPLFNSMTSLSHLITVTILECLSDALHVEPAKRFELFHRKEKPSQSVMTILHYPKTSDTSHIGHNKHTDIGTLTLLFAEQWGLQVYSPDKDGWAFVEPRPRGHATINVGDTLRFFSGKRLNSCVHRVIPITGETQKEDRYSIGFFLRASDDATYQGSDGRYVTAKEWHDEKFALFTESTSKQDESAMLTGGMEHIYDRLRPEGMGMVLPKAVAV